MSAPVWKKGPPPSLGWWPASCGRNEDILRWWDGELWSDFATTTAQAKSAAFFARQKTSIGQSEIEWTDRPKSWPARSRT